MRKLLSAIICAVAIAMPIATRAAVVDSVNESATAYAGITWNATDVGWFYTPSFSYLLNGINTKFASSGGPITEAIYTDVPANGGTLLRSATFTAVENTFSGGTFDDLYLTAGTQYFFGFINVGGMRLNVTADVGATELAPGIQYSFTSNLDRATFDAGPQMGRNAQPIVQFISDATPVPEPSSIALFCFGLFGFAVSRRKSAKSNNTEVI